MKIALVTPWYGENLPGGAETYCRKTAENLQKGLIDIEILTTCVKEFNSDWNNNFYKEGLYLVNGIPVRRFSVRMRNTSLFDRINYKLLYNEYVSYEEEEIFIQEMVNSNALYAYIRDHGSDYDFFLFIPYMFGTTYYGSFLHSQKTILIPCLHEERYAHMLLYRSMFENAKGIIYLSEPEKRVGDSLFNIRNYQKVLGGGIDTQYDFNPKRFRNKFSISGDFILYVGRRELGKNVPLLIEYFCQFKRNNSESPVKLLLIGSGVVDIPYDYQSDIIDLGIVSDQEKYDAYSAATLLCQPSINESFSIVIMESWLCGTPVLVHGGCAVTKDHCIKSNGGFFFNDYDEFEKNISFFLKNPEKNHEMAKSGKEYVESNYSWTNIIKKYWLFFKEIS